MDYFCLPDSNDENDICENLRSEEHLADYFHEAINLEEKKNLTND